MTSVCYWCHSPAPSGYPCCVPAWFFQIGMHESIARILSNPSQGVIGFHSKYDFRPPDNPEE